MTITVTSAAVSIAHAAAQRISAFKQLSLLRELGERVQQQQADSKPHLAAQLRVWVKPEADVRRVLGVARALGQLIRQLVRRASRVLAVVDDRLEQYLRPGNRLSVAVIWVL